eukprot:CAMPEP_0174709490 /NCGR_PEP_ID=MMETSP1094-20130205/11428_1 /TAXON_ID=156173 /ORGANISM="Chrysochromulina brevifilum, Strain UTEX LB 985" /LENGTH=44 /DNA_ID= /DNA_START= /DNA_END= /DNA_ORIENTATION=
MGNPGSSMNPHESWIPAAMSSCRVATRGMWLEVTWGAEATSRRL